MVSADESGLKVERASLVVDAGPAQWRRLGKGTYSGTSAMLVKLTHAGHLVVCGRAPTRGYVPVYDLAAVVRDRRRQALAYRSAEVPL